MHIGKCGKVRNPYQYKDWQAEISGDTEDTGGFYLILFQEDKQILYWEPTEEKIYQQVKKDGFEIEWSE